MSERFNAPEATEETTEAPQVDHPAARALEAARAKTAVDTSSLLTSYHDKIAEIRDDDALEDGPNNDYLSEQAKAEIIRDRKRASADELYQNTVDEYRKAYDSFAQEAEKHTAELRESLFGLGKEGSAVLAQAISADQAKLLEMINLGELTGVGSISRAAFAAAVTRGDAPEVVHTYLQKNPDAEPLLRLYQQAPTKEWVETQKENVSRLIQPASEDQLASRAQVRAW